METPKETDVDSCPLGGHYMRFYVSLGEGEEFFAFGIADCGVAERKEVLLP